jgi:hypothetical protein
VLPPASAGSGGGSGTLDVDGAAVVFAAEGPDVVAGLDVLGLALVLPDVVLAGACGLLKSVHDWVRNVSPSALTLSASAVTV